jgi:hypothetical protein
MTGGVVEGLVARAGSKVTIAGGQFGVYGEDGMFYPRDIALESGSEVRLEGTDFLLDGQPIAGLEPGRTVTLELGDPQLTGYSHFLSGSLVDGSRFSTRLEPSSDFYYFSNWNYDSFAPIVTVTMLLTADFDGSGIVDRADLTLWRQNQGQNALADANRDGVTDGQDLVAWQRQLGRRLSRSSSDSVPEPSAALLLCLAWALVAAARARLRESLTGV